MRIRILVATHKKYEMPEDEMYLPVFVGSAVSKADLPYQRDDEGYNISDRNRYYCELTGLYWAYRNLKDADYIGLNHYRRYFKYHGGLLKKADAEKLLKQCQVIVTKKRHYYIETVYSQFLHAHGKEGLDAVREVIKEAYPEDLAVFDQCMNRRSLHLFNMFIMRKDLFEEYCAFLFDVLKKTEERMEDTDRIYGFLGERLLDVYLTKNHPSYRELSVIHTEPIDWKKKIVDFIKRKYGSGK
ncbi:MAG: DUF4422 domain-containing protein [Erysipelotrichaceae bacterium]|nr:DUF4422 domain-containing protein [Erysipelotrichaceae bacterium]